MTEDFQHRDLRAVKKRAFRMGLACNYGIDARGFARALERGVNYFFWTPFKTGDVTPGLKDALRRDRERYIVATGPTVGFFGGSVRRSAESLLKKLDTDYIDIFQLHWLGTTSAWTEGTVAEMQKLREQGKVRALGISIHDRPRAGKLADDSILDSFMIRYNAAHPGAERDIFPHLARRNPNVIAYTATSWRKLLKAPSGWKDRVPTAGDGYRFCLTSPHVDVVLSGPSNDRELDENLAAIEKGPLGDDDAKWMREFGRVVHG